MVQIIKGSYGMRVGTTIKPVSANDGPVELSKEEEERLISLGVAVKVAANAEDESNAEEQKPNKPASKKARVKAKRTPKRKTTTIPPETTKRKHPQTNCPNSMRPMPSFE